MRYTKDFNYSAFTSQFSEFKNPLKYLTTYCYVLPRCGWKCWKDRDGYGFELVAGKLQGIIGQENFRDPLLRSSPQRVFLNSDRLYLYSNNEFLLKGIDNEIRYLNYNEKWDNNCLKWQLPINKLIMGMNNLIEEKNTFNLPLSKIDMELLKLKYPPGADILRNNIFV